MLASVTTARPVPFRAGRSNAAPGGSTRGLPVFTGNHVLLADISEFELNIADATYLSWSQAIVIRAAYGDAHDDHAWFGGQRRELLHAGGAQFLGIYQYIVANQDITAQAKQFCKLLGTIQPGEYLIADIEEGTGNLQQTWTTWANVVNAELGFPPGDYSGLAFAAAHGIQPADWLAAYQNTEPAVPHKLWQFTDAYPVPGVGTADCSVFHGTITQLAALAYQGTAPKPPKPPAVPAFPYPSGDYLGLTSADPHCHSGFTAADRPHVSTWQARMHARGWSITADGRYGPQSDSVARAFQAQEHLSVDGKVGPVTWAKSWTAPVT